MSLRGKVALVTGASRGIGRGIAIELGKAGATVYITGRRPNESDSAKHSSIANNTLQHAADEITKVGGKGIAAYCDHSDDDQIVKLFERIVKEQNSRLDILVNNAYAAVYYISANLGTKFYDQDPLSYDLINGVGLRNHYICTVLASRIMVKQKSGLIVTISSFAGMRYLFNVAYSIGKAACDRLAADSAVELKDSNVCHISLWPGVVGTEIIEDKKRKGENLNPIFYTELESPEFSGKCVVALANDTNMMAKTGRVCTSVQLADEYGLVDLDGKRKKAFLGQQDAEFMEACNKVRTSKF